MGSQSLLTSSATIRTGSKAAFTRTGLIVVIAVVGVLSGLAVVMLNKTKEKTITSRCAANLASVGVGMLQYARDHTGNLPPGSILYNSQDQFTWDTFIKSYLKAPNDQGKEELLLCPEDPFGHQRPTGGKEMRLGLVMPHRSYAMPVHNMAPGNWPPGPKNATGVGLIWNFGMDGNKPPPARIYNFADTNRQAAVNLSMIPDPGDTLMVTEQIHSKNFPWKFPQAVIWQPAGHIETNAVPAGKFQGGKINYLSVDGRVQTLFPRQTLGFGGGLEAKGFTPSGMWTIKPGD